MTHRTGVCSYGGRLSSDRGGAGLTIVLLLIAVALGVLSYMGYTRTKKAEEELKAANAKIATLENELKAAPAEPVKGPVDVPVVKGDSAADRELKLANAALGDLKGQVKELSGQKAALEAELAGAEAAADEAKGNAEALQAKLDANAETAAGLDEIKASAEASRKAAEDALGKLDAAEGAVEDLKMQLKKVQGESQVLATRLVEQLDGKDVKIGTLMARLKEYPVLPLDEAVAKEKYGKVVEIGGRLEGHDEKIAFYFKGSQMLLGTTYGARAKRLYDGEVRAKQVDLDKVAGALYSEARTNIKQNADAHADHVKFLQDALEKGRGSRYERSIQKLLDSEKKKADAAAKKAAEDAAKKAAEEAAAAEEEGPAEGAEK